MIRLGMVYNGKKWMLSGPLDYWQKRERDNVIVKHPGCIEFMDTAFSKLADEGLDVVLNSKYLKSIYNDIKIKYEK